MSKHSLEEKQEEEWETLYERIRAMLRPWGVENAFGRGDYLIVDDNYGWRRHTVEIHRLQMLQPEIIRQIRGLLDGFADWEIVIVVDVPGKEGVWPPMGLTLRQHEIIDGLRRELLPTEIRAFHYPDSRPGTGFD